MHAPLDPALSVEWRPLTALSAIADEWRDLASRALEPNAFYEPALLLAAAPVFGADMGAIVVRSRVGRLLGLFPMQVKRFRNGPGRTATGFVTSFGPMGVPLVDRDRAPAAIAAWLDHLAADRAMPALLMLPFLTETGPFATALDGVLAATRRDSASFGGHARAALDPGEARTDYVTRAIGAKKRKELRRQRNRLEDSGPVAIVTETQGDGFARGLQDMLVLEASGWKGAAGTAIVSDPAIRRFFETAVLALSAEGKARIDMLRQGERAIAACVTIQSGDTAWIWKISHCESLAKLSPGVQLVTEFTEAFLADPTIARADSLAVAGHPMIDHVWRERLAMVDRLIAVRPSAWPFAAACKAEQLRRDGYEAAKALRNRLRRS